jgi:Na+/proline symporter
MTDEDSITMIGLTIGILLAVLVGVLIRRGKLKPEIWPMILGIGAGVITFLIHMSLSMANGPAPNEGRNNLLWSFAMGVLGYVSGRIFASRARPPR